MMAVAEDVKLLGLWASPFVMRPRIALNLKKVKYEFMEETLFPKSELLLKSNPVHKKVPVLFHNGNPVCESLVIVQFIDEAWPSRHPLLPIDPYDRSLARFWASYIDEKWSSSVGRIRMAQTDEDRASSMEQMKGGLQQLEEAFVTCSKGKPFFGGDSLGLVDIALGSFVGWVRATEVMFDTLILDQAKIPNLVAWADRFCAHEAVKSVMPETKKLVELGKILQAAAAAPSAN